MNVRSIFTATLAQLGRVVSYDKPGAATVRIEPTASARVAPAAVADPVDGPVPAPEDMTRELTAPRLGSVRDSSSLGVARNLTPTRLANLLQAADAGDPDAYLSLAEEMEERYPHYLSVLGTRKRQVAQLPMTLAAASKGALDEEIARDVQENIIDRNILDNASFDLLDATGKGFSLGEMVWDTQPDKWLIDRIEWVNPRGLRFDRATQREPMRLDDCGQMQPLEQFKFVYLEIKAKSGLPIRGGLARVVAWAYMFQNFALKDWVQFCEIYGIPWRIGSYDQAASEKDKTALLRAVCALSGDAAAIKPKNMDIQVVESGATNSNGALFGDLAKYLDDQVSKVVLGQTRTVDNAGGGLNNGDAGTHVREDIERSDAKALEACFNKFVIQPYVILNYGPQKRYPYVTIGRPEVKDAQLMVDAAQKLGGGMKIAADDIRAAVGFRTPTDGDELYVPPVAASPFGAPPFSLPGPEGVPAPTIPTGDVTLNGAQITAVLEVTQKLIAREIPPDVAVGLISAVGIPEARARDMVTKALAQPQPPTPANDMTVQQSIAASRIRAELLAEEIGGGADAIALAAAAAGTARPDIIKPVRDEILRLAALSKNEDDFRRRLAAYRADIDMTPLADQLATLTFQAVAGGIVGDTLRR